MADRITPAQIRGARGMLGWSMLDLAEAAKVSISTVKRLEGKALEPVSQNIVDGVQSIFQAAGLGFSSGSDRLEGVWFDRV